jgi:hypothetical protein
VEERRKINKWGKEGEYCEGWNWELVNKLLWEGGT